MMLDNRQFGKKQMVWQMSGLWRPHDSGVTLAQPHRASIKQELASLWRSKTTTQAKPQG